MLKIILLMLCFCSGISTKIFAQKTALLTDDLKDFRLAMSLFDDKQYLSAQQLFNQILSQYDRKVVTTDCAYWAALCAIKSDQKNGDLLMEQFLENYPTSTWSNAANLEVGQHYFRQGNFEKAIDWFEKVDENNLSPSQQEMLSFQIGYSFFAVKNNKKAAKYLENVSNSKQFGAQAKYYLAYMAYQTDNFTEANKRFGQAEDSSRPDQKMAYFKADMYYRLGDFSKAIQQGEQALLKANETERSELNKIIGEAHFNLKNYDKAIPFLKQYQGKNGKWSNTDFYVLGYSYYKSDAFDLAVSQFNKIVDGRDFVAQNAYYHLGDCYLKLNKNTAALNAFKNASELKWIGINSG